MITQEARDPQQPCVASEGSTRPRGTFLQQQTTCCYCWFSVFRDWVTACLSSASAVLGLGIQKGMRHRPCSHRSNGSIKREKGKSLISILQRNALGRYDRSLFQILAGCSRNLAKARELAYYIQGAHGAHICKSPVVGGRRGQAPKVFRGPERALH